MISTEEIAITIYQKLNNSEVKTFISGVIDYERNDYTKEDVIIVPHTIDGEGSIRYGRININIHVPDLLMTVENRSVYRINHARLVAIRKKVIEVLKRHYEVGKGYNWTIGRLNPPIKEQDHNEHFVSLALELTVRNR